MLGRLFRPSVPVNSTTVKAFTLSQSDYVGLHAADARSLVATCNDILDVVDIRKGRKAPAKEVRRLFTTLETKLDEWATFGPVEVFVHARGAQQTFSQLQNGIYALGFPDQPTVPDCNIDIACLATHLEIILASETYVDAARRLRNHEASAFLCALQMFLDVTPTYERHEEAIKLLTNLADDAQRFPSDMELEDIRIENEWPFASGGYADVYRKSYKGQTVAVKKIRPDSASLADAVARRHRMEVLISRQLVHPNILPLLGVAKGIPLSLVTPWQENGNAREYILALRKKGEEPDYPHLFEGIAQGLRYLHSRTPSLTHGDIRGDNILIDSNGKALISDWGLAKFQHTKPRSQTQKALGSAARWTPPEALLSKDNYRTWQTDIYAFGMTMFELLTGHKPFWDCTTEQRAIHAVANFKLPSVPRDGVSPLLRSYQTLIRKCWSRDQGNRPSANVILSDLAVISEEMKSDGPFSAEPKEALKLEADIVDAFLFDRKRAYEALGVKVFETKRGPPGGLSDVQVIGSEAARVQVLDMIRSHAKEFAMPIIERLPVPERFSFEDRSIPEGAGVEALERRHLVKIEISKGSVNICGAKSLVDPAVVEVAEIISMFKAEHFSKTIYIGPEAVQYLRDAHATEDDSRACLEESTGTELELGSEGFIYVHGPQRLMGEAVDTIKAFSRNVPSRSKGFHAVHPERLSALHSAMSEIIQHCEGPYDKTLQNQLIRFKQEGFVYSGPTQLIERIKRSVDSGTWRERVVETRHFPVALHRMYPIWGAGPLWGESLADFGHSVGLVSIRKVEGLTSGPNPSRNSSLLYQRIELVGIKSACERVEHEIRQRIGETYHLQRTLEIPKWLEPRLLQLSTHRTLEGMGVAVDRTMEDSHGPNFLVWTITGKELRYLEQAEAHLRTLMSETSKRNSTASYATSGASVMNAGLQGMNRKTRAFFTPPSRKNSGDEVAPPPYSD